MDNLLWRPLFEAAGQTLVGAISSYAFAHAASTFFRENTFEGAMDLWQRGIHSSVVGEGDSVRFHGLISPYAQLFPGDPFKNAQRWNGLYSFTGRISSAEYQSLEFFAGSDAALRIGSLNGESLVGLYARYGFIGEGAIGVVPTKLILRSIPEFFSPEFIGKRAVVVGKLSRCPSQHAYVAQAIASRAGLPVRQIDYKNLPYIQISSVRVLKSSLQSFSLLGSAWAATDIQRRQYLVQYGYLNERSERLQCLSEIKSSSAWKRARVYFDDIDCPSTELSFKNNFMLI